MNQKDYYADYYAKNKERLNEKSVTWASKNPEKVKSYKRNWYAKNKERSKLQKEDWLKTTRGCLSKKMGHLKRQKRNKQLEFKITLDDLVDLWELQDGRCAISNYPMEASFNSLFSVSVDRINSSMGYTKENIQLVCQAINFAKNHYTNEEMIRFWEYRDEVR